MYSTRILLATANPGKLNELSSILGLLGIECVSRVDLGLDALDVPEAGATYAENATSKALAYQRAAGRAALADDSGLEVEALGGAPGPASARYAGEAATDSDRRRRLLAEMRQVPPPRVARYRCVIAVADRHGNIQLAEGECRGEIALEERGQGGFGYDPLFYLPEYGKTFGQLPAEVKNWISHRSRALQAARAAILQALQAQ